VAAMIDKKDQKQWGDPELDKAQAENDAIFAEMDGLKGLVEEAALLFLKFESFSTAFERASTRALLAKRK
jgi:hypothetical protein